MSLIEIGKLRRREEAAVESEVAKLLIHKLEEIEGTRASREYIFRDPAREVAKESGHSLDYVMHVLWALESTPRVSVIDGEFRLTHERDSNRR